jgi:hypothetical protein
MLRLFALCALRLTRDGRTEAPAARGDPPSSFCLACIYDEHSKVSKTKQLESKIG